MVYSPPSTRKTSLWLDNRTPPNATIGHLISVLFFAPSCFSPLIDNAPERPLFCNVRHLV